MSINRFKLSINSKSIRASSRAFFRVLKRRFTIRSKANQVFRAAKIFVKFVKSNVLSTRIRNIRRVIYTIVLRYISNINNDVYSIFIVIIFISRRLYILEMPFKLKTSKKLFNY